MAVVIRFLSGIAGASAACLLTAFHVRIEQGLWTLPLYALLGALAAFLISRLFPSKVMEGIASIFGGAIGGLVSEQSDFPAPEPLLVAAAIGGALWVVILSCEGDRRVGRFRGREGKTDETCPERPLLYLIISLIVLIGSPVLGSICFLAGYAGVHPMDRMFWFWRLLTVFAIGGSVIGIPYLVAWLVYVCSVVEEIPDTNKDHHPNPSLSPPSPASPSK
jgi:hypothetical protein